MAIPDDVRRSRIDGGVVLPVDAVMDGHVDGVEGVFELLTMFVLEESGFVNEETAIGIEERINPRVPVQTIRTNDEDFDLQTISFSHGTANLLSSQY